ncbi:hypothetical protein LZ554_001509 [Drepanopeziza brunnea f. sp. 'monogermtubi']|nr:hypothetical protein LZ554_001509 [Drepanopeziza brunnea f. sp. 'monogermtubi']
MQSSLQRESQRKASGHVHAQHGQASQWLEPDPASRRTLSEKGGTNQHQSVAAHLHAENIEEHPSATHIAACTFVLSASRASRLLWLRKLSVCARKFISTLAKVIPFHRFHHLVYLCFLEWPRYSKFIPWQRQSLHQSPWHSLVALDPKSTPR